MHGKRNWSWGEWVLARARHVGILSQSGLAAKVGTRPEQMSRCERHDVQLVRMSVPAAVLPEPHCHGHRARAQ